MPCACTTSPVAGAPGLAAGPPEPGTQENAEAPGRVDPARGRRRFGAGAPSARSARFARPHPALVAQLDRASDYGSEGWGFESLRARRADEQVNRGADRVDGARVRRVDSHRDSRRDPSWRRHHLRLTGWSDEREFRLGILIAGCGRQSSWSTTRW